MRIRVMDGERQIEISFKGSDPNTLRQAERTARRLAQSLTRPEKKRAPIGFGSQSVVSGGETRIVSADTDDDADDDEPDEEPGEDSGEDSGRGREEAQAGRSNQYMRESAHHGTLERIPSS